MAMTSHNQSRNPSSGNSHFNSQTKPNRHDSPESHSQGQNHPQVHHSDVPRQGPVASFRMNNVSISVFENEAENNGHVNRFYRAKIDKRYRDQKSGNWMSSSSLSQDELLRLGHLINQAVDFMSSKPSE